MGLPRNINDISRVHVHDADVMGSTALQNTCNDEMSAHSGRMEKDIRKSNGWFGTKIFTQLGITALLEKVSKAEPVGANERYVVLANYHRWAKANGFRLEV